MVCFFFLKLQKEQKTKGGLSGQVPIARVSEEKLKSLKLTTEDDDKMVVTDGTYAARL